MASPHLFITGSTGSGKSTILRDWLLPTVPRALILDQNGECETWPGVVLVETTRQAVEAFAQDRRRVVLTANDPEAEWASLAAILVPTHPGGPAFGKAVGGLTVISGEVDLLAPNGRTDPAWANVWRRGRHQQVAMWAATQRAAAVDRLVSAQAELIISCHQHEPRDLDYLDACWPPEVGGRLRHRLGLPKWGALVYSMTTREAFILEPDGPGQYVEGAWYDPEADCWIDERPLVSEEESDPPS